MSPWWRSITEDPGTAQLLHRAGAGLVALLVFTLAWRAGHGPVMPGRAALLLAAVLLQVALGIATLMLVVPLPLAVTHQAGAVVLLSATLYALHGLRRIGAGQ